MTVLHITPTFHPAAVFGGPIVSVLGLCRALARIDGVTISVLTTDSSGFRTRDRLREENREAARKECGFCIEYAPKSFGAEFSVRMLASVFYAVRRADIVHITYVYSWSSLAALLSCAWNNIPAVWSPRGALQWWPGSRKQLLKRVWNTVARRVCKRANVVLHCTSAAEAEESAKVLPGMGIAVIANGVDVSASEHESRDGAEGFRLMYLGRIHPKKGLDNLIEAMSALSADITLTIYGVGEPAYQRTLEILIETSALERRVRFAGHVDSAEREEAFSSADVLVLPSHAENFGMVVVEALARGLPVIASTHTPWADLVRHGCGLWVPNSPESLADAVLRMRSMDLERMGIQGRAWVRKEYSWDVIASRMLALYSSLMLMDDRAAV